MSSDSVADITVLLGDASLPDRTKPSGAFAPEDLDTIARMQAALDSLPRYRVRYLGRHETLLADLQAHPPSFVLNLCDTGFRNEPTLELHVAALLDLLGIPYSGAPPAAMVTCYDKGLVSALAGSLGVPVPGERYFETAEAAMSEPIQLPALIKPNQGDGSIGITSKAVVHSEAEARDYLEWLEKTLPGRSVLVQEYLPGPEYSVGMIGNPGLGLDALPVLEADFSKLPEGSPPILCYESKTMPDSPYWSDIGFQRAQLEASVYDQLLAHSRCLFPRLSLRDYARFDFRTDAQGTVKLMEVNPNPAWGYDGKMALMAGLAGMRYADLLDAILTAGLRRVEAERSASA